MCSKKDEGLVHISEIAFDMSKLPELAIDIETEEE